ncbi:MAG: hypothetical protein KAQ63_03065 [Candidatus Moranbacteria bacterium]|nr:hypothetical protein [Candidatus Moranbacteria bacterium]
MEFRVSDEKSLESFLRLINQEQPLLAGGRPLKTLLRQYRKSVEAIAAMQSVLSDKNLAGAEI